MKQPLQITDTDKGWKALADTLAQAKDSYVKVGLLGEKASVEEHDETALTNVGLMVIHEFGSDDGHIPERSVIRRTFDEHREEYVEQLVPLVRGIYEGRTTPKRALEILGYKMKWDMKRLIMEGHVRPPLAPSTIASKIAKGKWNKGSTAGRAPIPLLETGRLAAAIDHEVVLGGQPQVGGGEEQTVGSATLVTEE